METTYPENTSRIVCTWFDRFSSVASGIRNYPVAASSILCIALIALSHVGHVRFHVKAPAPAAATTHVSAGRDAVRECARAGDLPAVAASWNSGRMR